MPRAHPTKPPVTIPAGLPPPGATRWTAQRKAAVVRALRSGTLERHEAYDRYLLSDGELRDWEETFDRDGISGLLVKTREAKRHFAPRSKKP
jgi:hypothetical protein